MTELDDALLALIPAKKRDVARLLIRMKIFTPYQHAVADAFEWCERRQSESSDKKSKIVDDAARCFFESTLKKTLEEFTDSIHRAWIGRTWPEINSLLRIRAASKLLRPM